MQATADILAKHYFKQDRFESLTEKDILDFIEQYPYASWGKMFLALKLKANGGDFQAAANSAALHMNNPLWLEAVIKGSGSGNESVSGSESGYESVSGSESGNVSASESVNGSESGYESASESGSRNESVSGSGSGNESVNGSESRNGSASESGSGSMGVVEGILVEQPAGLPEEQAAQEPSAESDDMKAIPKDEFRPIPLPNDTVHKVEADTPLVFEPYHTIDYFASQGIKLNADDLSKDKFGRQLKSFTEWLRSMKKIPQGGHITVINTAETPVDPAVLQKADASVETSEVDTEAMAEVWAKQGKKARAIEIYEKLSLLNPSKSHYFAAKIEQLNA